MNALISKATDNNWKRLNTQTENRLTSRANKRRSEKKFIPVEYITQDENFHAITKIIELSKCTKDKTENILYTLACILLKRKGIFNRNHVQRVLSDYPFDYNTAFDVLEIPDTEKDLLGIIYQSLRTEGSKNINGSYYTPDEITRVLCNDVSIKRNQKALDPCCGSGAFLLSIYSDNPENLYGFDIDPIAVMLAKCNLLLKYSDHEFRPNIFSFDYLKPCDLYSNNKTFKLMKFDYIVTNPPWGGMQKIVCPEITSGETFSYFFVHSFNQLKDRGTICFLFPEAIANVKVHRDIRQFILFNTNVCKINVIERCFTGVLTKHIAITCEKSKNRNEDVVVVNNNVENHISLSQFRESTDYAFTFMSKSHQNIIDKIQQAGKFYLDNSDWALGIVTGNNKELLHDTPSDGEEPIYTGKEVAAYTLKRAKYYIKYDRKLFQQVAKDIYYRAEEKLVYKFISKRLVFSYDDQKSLLLNSANILIPQITHMSIKTVLAFLNSYVLQFYYTKKFDVLKVLKSNLMQLPFPEITCKQNKIIENYVDQLLNKTDLDCCLREELENMIFKLYLLTEREAASIKEEVCKNC